MSAACSPSSGLSVFVYYRVPRCHHVPVQSAVVAMQAALRLLQPGLHTRLMRRADETAAAQEDTWMEVYEHPDGVHDVVVRRLAELTSEMPGDLMGPRHVEMFCSLDPDPCGRS